MKRYLTAYVRTAAAGRLDDPSAPIPWVASSEGVKSDGLDLKASEWDLSRFAKHGPILWAHDYGGQRLPIGRGDARIERDRLLVDTWLDPDDDFAMAVRAKALKGMIAGSVGWERVGDKNRLIEFSLCPVGVDAEALPLRQAEAYLTRSVVRAVRRHVEPITRTRAALADLLRSLERLAREIR